MTLRKINSSTISKASLFSSTKLEYVHIKYFFQLMNSVINKNLLLYNIPKNCNTYIDATLICRCSSVSMISWASLLWMLSFLLSNEFHKQHSLMYAELKSLFWIKLYKIIVLMNSTVSCLTMWWSIWQKVNKKFSTICYSEVVGIGNLPWNERRKNARCG